MFILKGGELMIIGVCDFKILLSVILIYILVLFLIDFYK